MPRVAIVHDYLFQFGGAEKVVEKWLQQYPGADLYTSFFVPEMFTSCELITKAWETKKLHTTWVQGLFQNKFFQKFFKHFFWLYPIVMSFLWVKDYDLVLISSTNCGKNVRYKNCPKIIHYCHSPTRYLYQMDRETDLQTINPVLRKIIPLFTFWLKWMDQKAARYLNKNGCQWVANSKYIQGLIQEIYATKSIVIYPPVELEKYRDIARKVNFGEPFYFYFGRISFHKKVELIVQACLDSGKKVVIAGQAVFRPEMEKLKKMVANSGKLGLVEFVDRRVSDEEIKQYLTSCRAFLYPAKEDFGIVPIEVLSSGTPLIAYGAGGALEYIKDGSNGVLFPEQTVKSLQEGILKFEKGLWDSEKIKASSLGFSGLEFVKNIRNLVGF